MKMAINPFLKKIYKSSTSFSFYKEILGIPYAQTLKYFLGFIICIALIISAQQLSVLYKEINKLEEWLIKSEIRIENGKLTAKYPEPFSIKEPNFAFIFNPSAKAEDIKGKYNNYILINSDKIIVKNITRSHEIPFAKMDKLAVTPEKISKYKTIILSSSSFFIFISAFIGTLIIKLIQIILFSSLALFNSRLFKINFSFENFLNICTYALVPPTIFNLIFASLNIKISYFLALYFAMYTLFIVGAIRACQPVKAKKVIEEV